MSDKVLRFLNEQQPATPCLVVDLDVVEEKYRGLTKALPLGEVFYAVKANPAQEVLARLAALGASFDTASSGEIAQVLSLGVAPERISFGNTIKKQSDIAWAHARGVKLYAFDSKAELEKIAVAAPTVKHVPLQPARRHSGSQLGDMDAAFVGHGTVNTCVNLLGIQHLVGIHRETGVVGHTALRQVFRGKRADIDTLARHEIPAIRLQDRA